MSNMEKRVLWIVFLFLAIVFVYTKTRQIGLTGLAYTSPADSVIDTGIPLGDAEVSPPLGEDFTYRQPPLPPPYYRFAIIQDAESVHPPLVANFDSSDVGLEVAVISGSGDATSERNFQDSDVYVVKPNAVWWTSAINRGLQGWPISSGDVDGDQQKPDILATSPLATDKKLFAFQPNGNLIGGSPLVGYSCFSTAVSDVVPSSGGLPKEKPICAGANIIPYGGRWPPRIWVFSRQNNLWQLLWTFGSTFNDGGAIVYPASGDVDGDGNKEIAFQMNNVLTSRREFFLIKGEDGTYENGWPVPTPTPGFQFYFNPKPTIADIYGDSNKEIVVLADNSFIMQPGQEEGIIVFNAQGAMSVHQIDLLANHDTVVANVERSNHHAEIIVQGQGSPGTYIHRLNVFRFSGQSFSQVSGWPQSFIGRYDFAGPTVVGDIDGDSENEIVIATVSPDIRNALVYAWNLDGTSVSGYPKQIPTGQPSPIPNAGIGTGAYQLALADIDGNGRTDIVLQSSEKFDMNGNGILDYAETYITVLPTNGDPNIVEWPQFGGNNQRTRCHLC